MKQEGSSPIRCRRTLHQCRRQQTARVREALDSVVRERSGESGPAVLTAPINIGIRTK